MATLYVTEYQRFAEDSGGRAMNVGQEPAVAEQQVAIGGASTPSAAFGASTKLIRVQPVPQPIYRHKRGKSAAFIPGVAPPVVVYTPFRRRRHAPNAQLYKHKCRRSAHFIPNVAPPLITTVQDVLLVGVNTGRLMTHN